MAWQTPKTNWAAADGVRDTDFNRIEGNTLELYNTKASGVDVNGLKKYAIPTTTKTSSGSSSITASPIPTSGWTAVTAGTAYKSGTYEIFASSYHSTGLEAMRAFDNNVSERWSSIGTGTEHYIGVKLPAALTVSKVKLYCTGATTLKVQGSTNGSSWTDLYTTSTMQTSLTEVTLTSTGTYNYYRLYLSRSSSGGVSVYEFQLSAYTIPSATMAYTVSGVPTTWEANQRVMIETPSTDTVGVVSNTLNGISVDTILKPSTKYELVYKSNKFYAKEA